MLPNPRPPREGELRGSRSARLGAIHLQSEVHVWKPMERLEARELLSHTRQAVPAAPVATSTATPAVVQKPAAKNLLFFGNSFTYYNSSPQLLRDIAIAAGQSAPNIYQETNPGWALKEHVAKLAADGSGNIIDASLPAGQHWDDVIIQELSTRSVARFGGPIYGDPTGFRNDAKTIFAHVRQNSPAAHAVVFETWADGPSSVYYPSGYASPADMQADERATNQAAVGDLNGAFGAGAAGMSPVGDAYQAMNWNRNLYDGNDEHHPDGRGSLLEALVLFRSTYHMKVSSINVSSLASDLSSRGMTAADFTQLAAVADGMNIAVTATPVAAPTPVVKPAPAKPVPLNFRLLALGLG